MTQASNALAFAAQGGLLIFFVALYVAYLSLLAFALTIGIVGVAAALFHARNRQITAANREAAEWENRLFNRLMDMLNGFKEVRLNHPRLGAKPKRAEWLLGQAAFRQLARIEG